MKDFEALVNEFAAAEQAGVFSKTAQPSVFGDVRDSRSPARIFWVSPRWAIAAALLMALGVWTVMFRVNLSDVRDRSRMLQLARSIDLRSTLASCVGGPSGQLNGACDRVDFDRDGDVDLSDF